MPQPKDLSPAAYGAEGGPVGVLLIHGFTGSVAETRPMGEYLAGRGLAVRCPLLPGHGTTAEDLTHISWREWTGAVEAELEELKGHCPAVFVGGLSLGSLLTLWLGMGHPEIGGLILMAPALAVRDKLLPLTVALRYLLKYNPLGPMADTDLGDPAACDRIWCYDQTPLWGAAEVYLLQRRVRRGLAKVRQPVLIFQGRRDIHVPPEAAEQVYHGVSSTDKTLVWLDHSGHNVLADGERETIWSQSYDWILARAGG